MNQNHKVIVIGGGITGLTVTHHLHRQGIDAALFEREVNTGGTITTLQNDGWVVERGPNSGLDTTPLLKELFTELGIKDKLIYANPCADKRYVLRNGDLHPIPMSPLAFFSSKLWSASGKFRILKEPFIGKSLKEETISEFVTRRLGTELLDYAINPFVAGVFAGDPSKLSVRSAFPKLYALEEKYGGLIRGMIMGARERKKRAEKAKDRSRQFSFINGMQMLPDAIHASLGNKVNCRMQIVGIRNNAGNGAQGFSMEVISGEKPMSVTSDIVVLAIPSYAAAELIKEFDPELARDLASIYYPPVAEVFLGYGKGQVGRPLDGFGFLIPEKENRKILGTIWSSVIFPGRAPDGFDGFTTFLGGSRQPAMASLPDKELVGTVHGELKEIMKIQGEPVVSFINRWERAIPQYQLGHGEIMKRIEDFEIRHKGLVLGGNYRGGISISDCIISAKRISDQVRLLMN